jgi:predicted DsbA family dithiol-disulfide isomerase
MSIAVSVTSDFICPWCLVGERRLTKAISTLPKGIEVDIEWKPFELNPNMPAEGMDRRLYRSLKFGSWERNRMLDAQTAKRDSVAFDYAAIEKTPNTFRAHRLMRLAKSYGLATRTADALFSAYFEKGHDIGRVETLTDIAVEQGLERAEVAAFLASDEAGAEVRAAEEAHHSAGIRSVPSFNIGGEILSGAQSVETFETALRRAAERDSACSTGSCTVA